LNVNKVTSTGRILTGDIRRVEIREELSKFNGVCASRLNVNGIVCLCISSAVLKCSSEFPVYELITPKSCIVAPRDFIHSSINFLI